MNRKYVPLIPVLGLGLFMLFSAFGGDENSDYPGGSPAGYTGSPGDGHDCTACHGGSTSFEPGWITSDIPAEGYTPGITYNLTVTVSGSGDKGFQVSPQDLSGNQLGILVAGTGTHLNGGTKYVNQNSKSTANPAIWNFQWIAPDAGTGEVTFYGAFTVNKPVTKTSTLIVQEAASVPLEVVVSAEPGNICTGDSSHLEAVAAGGSGSYTYQWTSDPPGFTSSASDPWVFPTETTTYYVEVSDGVQMVEDSVEVSVYCLGTPDGASGDPNIMVYPNPFKDNLMIDFQRVREGTWTVSMYRLTGQKVYQQEFRPTDADPVMQIDPGTLPDGSYILSLISGKEKRVLSIIKRQ